MNHFVVRRSIHSLLILFAVAGCKDDGGDGGTAGTGVAGAGIAGVGVAGAGVAGVGVAGAAGGAAGAAGGAAGAAGGAAGMAGMAGMGGMAGTGGPTYAPTFSAIFTEIISGAGCNGGSLCHGGQVGMLNMLEKQATYDALVNVPAKGMNLTGMPPHCANSGLMRVVPRNPDMSLLVQKIEQMMPSCGTVMPPNPPMLSAEQRMQVRTWIANGAMND